MRSKIAVLLTAILATAVYFIAGQGNNKNRPDDLRDAVSSDFNTAIPVLSKGDAQIPAPAAPQRLEKSKTESGQEGQSKPFIMAELISARLAGGTPQETRDNVEAFLGKLGLKIIFYQDNDAYNSAQLNFRQSEGTIDAVKLAYAKSQDLRTIKQLAEVKEIYPVTSYYRVIFSRDLYSPRIRAIFSEFPDLTVTLPPKNRAMAGSVWTHLATDGMDNPKAVAARLKKQFPDTISSAQVMVSVEVARFSGN
ncbi:MAG: hypothetical protein NTX59_00670 [Elusimicrobia bacterium]|nr:hypothetical protein [Elusimicrobiota bacterium]